VNPEQPVLDEIDRLVDWQIEEGKKRGDDLPEFDSGERGGLLALPARARLRQAIFDNLAHDSLW
jgi:hypothetical protein